MATEHDELENGIAAYVLGSAQAEEHERLRAHIEACASCRALAVRLSRGLAALPLEPDPVEPPARLHGRVVAAAAAARAGGEPRRPRPRFHLPEPPRPHVRLTSGRVALGAAAALLFAFAALTGVGVARLGPFRQDLQTVERYQLTGSGQMAGVQASAVRLRDAGVTVVEFRRLPQPAPGRVYELWLIRADGTAEPSAVFMPESGGSRAVVLTADLSGITTLAVTEEAGPNGGGSAAESASAAGGARAEVGRAPSRELRYARQMARGARSTRRARAFAGQPTIVAVNGLGGLEYLWDAFRAALPPPVELRFLDLPGHGDRRPAEDYRYATLVADVVQRTDDLSPFPLLGWSVGGAVAWLVAARHPERVTRLVLLDPAAPHQSPFRHGPTPEPVHLYTYASAEEALQALHAIDPTVTEDAIRRGYRQNERGRWEPRSDPAIFPALVEDAREHGDEFRGELERVGAPTLFVRGERSFWRPDQLAEMTTLVPDAHTVTVQGAGHFMVREQPERVARLVLEFLEL